MKRRKIFASEETAQLAKKSNYRIVQVYSFFPIDRASCFCQKMIKDYRSKLDSHSQEKREEFIKRDKHLVCPRDKTGMRRRVITCNNCDEIQGYLWARDNTLKDWCDFHYVQWTETREIKSKKSKKVFYETLWHGCFTPHISPITEELCLECTCGQDTRDFKANMTMNVKEAYKIEDKNKIGREFGESNSKFATRVARADVLPFK